MILSHIEEEEQQGGRKKKKKAYMFLSYAFSRTYVCIASFLRISVIDILVMLLL
jgi:hypothetical protein